MNWDEGGHYRQQKQQGPTMKARKSMAGSRKAKLQCSTAVLEGACWGGVGNGAREGSSSPGAF